jgi:hypothetical protein
MCSSPFLIEVRVTIKNEKKAKAIPQIIREIVNANELFTILFNISIRKEEI